MSYARYLGDSGVSTNRRDVSWSMRMPSWMHELLALISGEFGIGKGCLVRGALIAHFSLVRRCAFRILDDPVVSLEDKARVQDLIHRINEGIARHVASGGFNPADAGLDLGCRSGGGGIGG